MTEDIRLRVRWSDFEYYSPIRFRITDWDNLTIFHRNYILVDSEMDYKGRKVELCVPYHRFVNKMRMLPIRQQRAVIKGEALVELTKLPKVVNNGMIIKCVECDEVVEGNE